MATRENGAFAVEWLLVLSREEDLFFNPRSGEKNLMQVVERFMPGSTLDSIHAVEDRPETFRYDFAFKTAQRDIFFNVYVNSIETWLDVSESNPGLGGSSIYAAVAKIGRAHV